MSFQHLLCLIFIFFLNISITKSEKFTFGGEKGWNNCYISNIKIKYIRNKYHAITPSIRKKKIDNNVDLFLDFNSKASKLKDKTGNYIIEKAKYKINPSIKFNNSQVAWFFSLSDIILLKPLKSSLLSEKIDIEDFTIDFFIMPSTSMVNSTLFKKGIYSEGKFYGINFFIKDGYLYPLFENFFYDEKDTPHTVAIDKLKLVSEKWQRITLSYQRNTGKLTLYKDGNEYDVKYATTTFRYNGIPLIPKFNKIDDSFIIIGKNFLGYLEDFRILKYCINPDIFFSDKPVEGVVYSSVIKLGNSFNKVKINVSTIGFQKSFARLYIRYSKKNFRIDNKLINWQELGLINTPKKFFYFNSPAFLQWKIEFYKYPNETPYITGIKLHTELFPPPLPPKSLKIYQISKNSIKVKWEPPADKSIIGYLILIGKTKGEYEKRLDIGNKNEYIIENLQNGMKYYMKVVSYNTKKPFYNMSKAGAEGNIILR